MLNHVVRGRGADTAAGTGLWLTVRMKGLQIRGAGTACAIRGRGEASRSRRAPRQDQGAITLFQSMCTALAGTLGTGQGRPQPSSAAGRGGVLDVVMALWA